MFNKKSLTLAVLFSLFIYCEYFGISNKLINSIAILYGYYLIFRLNKKELFGTGFLIGFLWFWWVGYSFSYYDLSYLIPFVVIGIGLVYGLLFYIGGLVDNIIYKVLYFFSLSYIDPFSFNWFKLELPLINSYFGTSKIELFILLSLSAYLVYKYNKKSIIIYFSILLSLYFYNHYHTTIINKPDLKINIYNTAIDQDIKWDRSYTKQILDNNILAIEKSIKSGDDIIIFPETSFPLVLNHQKQLENVLLKYSKNISIVLGALYEKDDQLYNSTYLFQDNTIQIANKVVLVPFGEAVPLPKILSDIINNTFYDGAEDYKTAKEPTTFNIKGTKFRNAICYEATTNDIYQNLDTNYVIAISNNAWFTPSIQPTLQKLLMKYYSKKYNLYIYNVTNKG